MQANVCLLFVPIMVARSIDKTNPIAATRTSTNSVGPMRYSTSHGERKLKEKARNSDSCQLTSTDREEEEEAEAEATTIDRLKMKTV